MERRFRAFWRDPGDRPQEAGYHTTRGRSLEEDEARFLKMLRKELRVQFPDRDQVDIVLVNACPAGLDWLMSAKDKNARRVTVDLRKETECQPT